MPIKYTILIMHTQIHTTNQSIGSNSRDTEFMVSLIVPIQKIYMHPSTILALIFKNN